MALVQALKTGPEGSKKLQDYYSEEDYYLGKGDERFQLHFDGQIADQLGIKGVAKKEDWQAVTKGDYSRFGEKTLWNGKGQHRIGADIGFSAPKSFSIAALVSGDDRLIEVHKRAIEACKKVYEEECIVARYGHGSNIWKNAEQALFAHVTHISNRDQEPQLHEHLLILNVTRGEDGELRKMESKLLVEKQKLLNEIYLQKLAEGAKELGYDVEWRKSLNGNVVQPEIADVSREQIQAFSKRSAEVEAYLKDKYGVNAQEATPRQRRTAALATRKRKEETNLEELRKTWKVEANKLGVRITSDNTRNNSEYNGQHVEKALKDALGHFLEREASVQESQLLAKAMFFGREHGIRYEDIRKCYDDMKRSGNVVEKEGLRANKLITDKKSLFFETKLIESVRRGKGQVEPAETKENVINKLADTKLSEEQKEVAAFLLTSTDRVVGVNGYAGAGKTTTLKPVVETLKEKGFDVIGLAPSHKAVEALGDAGVSGQTMQGFIHPAHLSENLERMSTKTVLVLDEAGMVSTKDMVSVLAMAEKKGARVILSGDIKQHQSVEAGPAFKIVQNIARGDTKYIKTIVRQANAETEVRESLKDVAEDVKGAAKKLLQAGLIKEIENREELYGTVAVEYVHSIGKNVDTVVITETNRDRIEINKKIREILFKNAEGERKVTTFRVKNVTEAEKTNKSSYEEGDVVRFQREYATLDVKMGETYKVKHFLTDKVAILEDKAGKELKFDITKYKSFDIGKIEEMPVCVGEKIRITDNSLLKKAGLTNGLQAEVTGFGEKTIHVTLENGRKTALNLEGAPIDYRYAGTGHSTQGKTVSHEILVRDPSVSDARSFYTDVTRTKKSAVVYTSNTDALLSKLGVTKEKLLARDAVKEKPTHSLAM